MALGQAWETFKKVMRKSFPTPDCSSTKLSTLTGTKPVPNLGHTVRSSLPYFERSFLPNFPLSVAKQTTNTSLGTTPASAMRVDRAVKRSMPSLSFWETLSNLCVMGGVSPGKQEEFMDLDTDWGKAPMKCLCH